MRPATRGADASVGWFSPALVSRADSVMHEQVPRLAIVTLAPLTPYLDSLIGFVPDHISTVCYLHHLLAVAPTPDGLLHHEAPGVVATD